MSLDTGTGGYRVAISVSHGSEEGGGRDDVLDVVSQGSSGSSDVDTDVVVEAM